MEQPPYFFIDVIYRHRNFIVVTALLFSIVAVIATSKNFIEPVYSSEIIFYPPSAAISRSYDNVKSYMVQDKEIEEHLQTILSGNTQNILISKYHLASHYQIDTTENEWRDNLKSEWQSNFKVSRTRYNSISIVVFDTDKYLAAQIANDAASIADSIKNELLKNALRQNLMAMEFNLSLKIAAVDSVATELGLSAANIAFASSQSGNTTLDLAQKQMSISKLLDTQNKYDLASRQPTIYKLSNLLKQVYDLENAVSQLQIVIGSPPLSSYVLSKAEPSFKKTSPKRMLITLFAFIGGLFFAAAIVMFNQQWKYIKQQLR